MYPPYFLRLSCPKSRLSCSLFLSFEFWIHNQWEYCIVNNEDFFTSVSLSQTMHLVTSIFNYVSYVVLSTCLQWNINCCNWILSFHLNDWPIWTHFLMNWILINYFHGVDFLLISTVFYVSTFLLALHFRWTR